MVWLAGSSPLRPHSAAHWARPALPGHLGGGISAPTRRGCERPDTTLPFIHGFCEPSLSVQVARAGPAQSCQARLGSVPGIQCPLPGAHGDGSQGIPLPAERACGRVV